MAHSTMITTSAGGERSDLVEGALRVLECAVTRGDVSTTARVRTDIALGVAWTRHSDGT